MSESPKVEPVKVEAASTASNESSKADASKDHKKDEAKTHGPEQKQSQSSDPSKK